MSGFDPQKHILQIQFRSKSDFPFDNEDSTFVTVDSRNQVLIIRVVDSSEKETLEKVFRIDEESFSKLLPYLELERIRKFERFKKINENKLMMYSFRGFRDCYSVEYTYHSMGRPAITHGTLSSIFEDNPIENITDWITKFIPEEHIIL